MVKKHITLTINGEYRDRFRDMNISAVLETVLININMVDKLWCDGESINMVLGVYNDKYITYSEIYPYLQYLKGVGKK